MINHTNRADYKIVLKPGYGKIITIPKDLF